MGDLLGYQFHLPAKLHASAQCGIYSGPLGRD
jgi:hypothetical protein